VILSKQGPFKESKPGGAEDLELTGSPTPFLLHRHLFQTDRSSFPTRHNMSSAAAVETVTVGGFTAVCRSMKDADGKERTLIADCIQETKTDGRGGIEVTYRQAVKDEWLPLEQGTEFGTCVVGPVLRLDEMEPSIAGAQVLYFADNSITGRDSFFNPAIPRSTPEDATLCRITLGEYMGDLFHDLPTTSASNTPLESPVYKSKYDFNTTKASGLSNLPRLFRRLARCEIDQGDLRNAVIIELVDLYNNSMILQRWLRSMQLDGTRGYLSQANLAIRKLQGGTHVG
jgi:hypothetical protein